MRATIINSSAKVGETRARRHACDGDSRGHEELVQSGEHDVVNDANVVGDLLAHGAQLRLLQERALRALATTATRRCRLPRRGSCRTALASRGSSSGVRLKLVESRIARTLHSLFDSLPRDSERLG